MTFGSLFSGAGGFDLGFEQAGFRCLWQVECDRTANDVRRRHWPNVEHFRDVVGMSRIPKRHGGWLARWERPDVIIGGFPCQDLSVAGKRAGLSGNRSGLWWQMLRVIRGLRPACVVWENVPGLLSSDSGRDFARVLLSLGDSGYRGGWRVLDAQHFGVPQRRRRVFGVFFSGRAGERRAAQVLALRDGLRWDSPAGRTAGEDIAGSLGGGSGSRGWSDDLDRSGAFVAGALSPGAHPSGFNGQDAYSGHLVAFGGNNTSGPIRVAAGLNARSTGRQDFESETFIAFNWNATNAGASELSPTIRAQAGCGSGMPAVAHSLRAEGFDASEDGTGRGTPLVPVSFQERGRDGGRSLDTQTDLAYALTAPNGGGRGQERNIVTASAVRRLTPRECERLMGWPDDFTRYRFDGSEVADGPRYRLCGNGVVAPVAEWIGRRLMEANQ